MRSLVSFNSDEPPRDIYSLVDETGGGILVPWIKYARSSGDFNILEEYLDTAVRSCMYNGGKGKLVAISELEPLRRKKGRGKGTPNILDDVNQEGEGGILKALKVLDGANFNGQNKIIRYREIVWDINLRGKVERIVKPYNFKAIVNEDQAMVYFLLRHGADVNQRCYGSFFCADDQKASRTDSLEYEWVDLTQNTNYTGQMYWGEFPLSYAACTSQEDCFRLLRAFKASPNQQDTNGNTVLHIQAFSIIFLACEREESVYMQQQNLTTIDYSKKFTNIMKTPWASLMRMFIMSVGEFSAFYKNLHEFSVMLLNLLIAMMTRTYEKIAEAEKEWKRQWAKVILMMEQSITTSARKLALFRYSRPLKSNIRQRAFIVLEKGAGQCQEIHSEEVKKRPSMIRLSPHIQITRSSFRSNGSKR
ncbi:unnamed protein product, partial [Mesorhabditis spiculigera]